MNILFVATQLPLPADTGGRIRSFNLIKHLSRKHQVTFVCSVDRNTAQDVLEEMARWCSRFIGIPTRQINSRNWLYFLRLAANFLSPTPFGVSKDYHPALAGRIRDLLKSERFDVLVCDFLHAAVNLKGINSVATVLFQHNVEAEIFRRYYLQQTGPLRKLFWLYQWKKMQRYESHTAEKLDCCVAVSPTDQLTFERDYKLSNVAHIDTGVDLDYFSSVTASRLPKRIVFTGSMDWLPNEDGVLWFVRDVLPEIRNCVPGVSFTVVGRKPSSKVRQLVDSFPDIQITGRVEDVRPYLAESSVFVVPIRIGGGTRIKIFEAMASGTPVVSTSVGAEGLPVVDQDHLLKADTAETFARAVVTLLRDQRLSARLAEQAKLFVSENFDWARISDQFSEVCSQTLRRKQGTFS